MVLLYLTMLKIGKISLIDHVSSNIHSLKHNLSFVDNSFSNYRHIVLNVACKITDNKTRVKKKVYVNHKKNRKRSY